MTHSFDQQAHAEPAPIAAPNQQRLPSGLREDFAAHFGADFDDIRTQQAAPAATANGLDALTVGDAIAFRDTAYQPKSGWGRELIAHELGHVVQQRGSTGGPSDSGRLAYELATAGFRHKLKVDQPGDVYEQEAGDRAVTGLLRPSQVPLVPASDPPTGSSFDSATRSRMESLLGADFSQVRVQADAESPPGLTPSRVPAYTIGHDVHLVGGQYAPHRPDGTWILAHELAHVAQQTRRGNGSGAAPAYVAEQEARAAADAVSDNKPFHVRSWTGVCLACAPPAPTGPQPVPAQAEPEESLELKFFGEAGESGVGAFYIRDWSTLSPPEQVEVLAWFKDADFHYGFGAAGPRQPVSSSMRETGDKVSGLGRKALGLGKTSASGHVPDMAGGGDPIGVQSPLPARVNNSIGGQWGRYKPNFGFTGLSGYDHSTGQWIYQSAALEDELAPTAPGPPVRTAPSTTQATAPAEVPHPGGSQTTEATTASEVETIAPTESAAAAPGVVSPGATPTAPVEEPVTPEPEAASPMAEPEAAASAHAGGGGGGTGSKGGPVKRWGGRGGGGPKGGGGTAVPSGPSIELTLQRQELPGIGPSKSWTESEIDNFELWGYEALRGLATQGPAGVFKAVFGDPTRLAVATATVMASPHMFGARGGLQAMAAACMNPANCMKTDWRYPFINGINISRELQGKKPITWGDLMAGKF